MDAERGTARPRAFVTVYGVVVNSRKIVERAERRIGIATTTTETRPAWLRNEHARHVMRAKRANHALHQEVLRNTWRTFEKYNALGASCFSAGRTRRVVATWINSIYVKTIGRIPLPFQKILSKPLTCVATIPKQISIQRVRDTNSSSQSSSALACVCIRIFISSQPRNISRALYIGQISGDCRLGLDKVKF